MLGLAIALADDDVSAEEREVATQLSAALGLGLLSLDSLIAEIRG
jgi:tellurite resistance protein